MRVCFSFNSATFTSTESTVATTESCPCWLCLNRPPLAWLSLTVSVLQNTDCLILQPSLTLCINDLRVRSLFSRHRWGLPVIVAAPRCVCLLGRGLQLEGDTEGPSPLQHTGLWRAHRGCGGSARRTSQGHQVS